MSTAAVMDDQQYSEASENGHVRPEYGLQDARDEARDSAPSIWRSLVHLKLLLPYLGKFLPLLETGLSNAISPAAPARVDMSEMHHSLDTVNRGFVDLQVANRDIRAQIQEQSGQLKRVDEQLLRLRESTERNTMEHQELVEDLRSASKLVRGLSAAMIVLLLLVAVMVGFMLLHWRHA